MSNETTTTKNESTESKFELEGAEIARILKEATAKGKPVADIAPVGYSFSWNDEALSPASPAENLVNDSIVIQPVIDPVFDAALQKGGVRRIGNRSWQVGVGKTSALKPLQTLFSVVPGAVCYPESSKLDKVGYTNVHTSERAQPIIKSLLDSPLLNEGKGKGRYSQGDMQKVFEHVSRQPSGPFMFGNLVFSFGTNGMLTIRATTNMLDKEGMRLTSDGTDLHLWTVDGTRTLPTVKPDEALRILDVLKREGVYVEDNIGLEKLREQMDKMLVAYRMPGAPGLARLVVGAQIRRVPSVPLPAREKGCLTTVTVDSIQAGNVIERADAHGVKSVMDDAIADVGRMATSKGVGLDREGGITLRPYQAEAVGLHLATRYGYVNACSVGLGKTVMTLEAWQERAKEIEGWQGLVVCPAAIRSQWVRETEKFFPGAAVKAFDGKGFAKAFEAFKAENEDVPRVLVMSYDAMRSALKVLTREHWHDLACDEAAILKNPGALRTQALWDLRACADIAVGLTGTPIEKSLDDMGRIIAWVRNDPKLFYGARLEKEFDMTVEGDAHRMWKAIGPLVFRRDRSEIADELPRIETETVILDPTPQELALANGARKELKRMFTELDEQLAEAIEADPDDPLLDEARAELRSLRGAVLGGVTLARMAASDPEAVAASESAAKLLLDNEGLVEPAVRKGGTKRARVGELLVDLASRGDAVLVFTDFETCARHLAKDIEDQGVRVGLFTGKNQKVRDINVQKFQDGELDVLILTRAAREGLNLQRANVLVNYDLPWVPTQLVQRIGRACRIGSESQHLMILNPIMAGTIEERVAATLLPRAAKALAALDTIRGKKASETEMGMAMSGLSEAATDEEADDVSQLDYARLLLDD